MPDFILLSAQKPKFGEPCNGCGWCCQNEACKLSVEYLGSSVAPCIALEWDGAQYRCGLLKHPHEYVPGLSAKPWGDEVLIPLFATALAAGKGCDAA